MARFLDERSQPEAPDDDDPWADEEDGPDEDGSGHAGWDEDAAPTAGRHDDVEEVAPQPVRQQPRPLVTQPRPTRGDPAPSRPVQTRSAMDRPQRPQPTLTPAEIQSRLRSGDSVRAVAKAAGVDEEWVRRWEVPILAERVRVLEGAHAARIHRPRLGRSAQPLGTAVRHNLGQRVDPDTVTWDVARRRDGRWRVTVRWVAQGGRKRSATWTWDEQERELVAASDAARDLGFVRRATRG